MNFKDNLRIEHLFIISFKWKTIMETEIYVIIITSKIEMNSTKTMYLRWPIMFVLVNRKMYHCVKRVFDRMCLLTHRDSSFRLISRIYCVQSHKKVGTLKKKQHFEYNFRVKKPY